MAEQALGRPLAAKPRRDAARRAACPCTPFSQHCPPQKVRYTAPHKLPCPRTAAQNARASGRRRPAPGGGNKGGNARSASRAHGCSSSHPAWRLWYRTQRPTGSRSHAGSLARSCGRRRAARRELSALAHRGRARRAPLHHQRHAASKCSRRFSRVAPLSGGPLAGERSAFQEPKALGAGRGGVHVRLAAAPLLLDTTRRGARARLARPAPRLQAYC